MMSALSHVLDVLDARACLLLLSLLLFTYNYFIRPKNLPPGPWGWPIIGRLLSVIKIERLHLEFMEWQKKYGHAVYFRMGMLDAVVLGGHDTIHQALVKQGDVFSSRPKLVVLNEITKGKGIVMAPYGPHWKEQRKFTLSTLRSFGFGRRSLEVKITEESAALREGIYHMGGKPFDINRLLEKATANIICSLVFSRRLDYDNPQISQLMEAISEMAEMNIVRMAENIFPFLIHVLNSGDQLLKKSQLPLSYVRAQIKEHEEIFDPNDIRDLIDAFLLQMRTQHRRDSIFTEDQMTETVFELFLAGIETLSISLRWASLLMIAYPNIQRKVHEEIDSVLGKGQPPSMSHRAQLPYTQAVLTETARFATILPLSVPLATSEDTVLNGYHIPKNCLVFPNIWSVHHDEKLFPQPDKFDPTRFLDDDGQFKKDDHVMPFSKGPRTCLGEQLARMELFLFFTSLMQHFTFKLPEGAPAPSLEGRTALVRSTGPFNMVAVLRN